jgi:hypothetical protein
MRKSVINQAAVDFFKNAHKSQKSCNVYSEGYNYKQL